MQEKFYNIQVLRFWAAVAVILVHSEVYYSAVTGQPTFLMRPFGFTGVDIFFTISGFIMWMTTKGQGGMRDTLRFAYNRLTRILIGFWPFFAVLLATRFWLQGGLPEDGNFWKTFFLIPQPHKENLYTISWTLSFELYFYTLFALAILWRGRAATLVLGGILIPASIIASLTLPQAGFTPLTFLLSPHIMEFFGGVLVGFIVERGWVKRGEWIFLAGCAVLAVMAWVNITYYGNTLSRGTFKLERALWLTPVSMLLMLGLIGMKWQAGARNIMTRLGDASYTTYLAHVPFLMCWKYAVQNDRLPSPWLEISLIATVALTHAFALYYFERHEIRMLRKIRKLRPF